MWEPDTMEAARSPGHAGTVERAALVWEGASHLWPRLRVTQGSRSWHSGALRAQCDASPLGTVDCGHAKLGGLGKCCCQTPVIYSFAEKQNKRTSAEQTLLWFVVLWVLLAYPSASDCAQRPVQPLSCHPFGLMPKDGTHQSPDGECEIQKCSVKYRASPIYFSLCIAFWWWYSQNWAVCEHSCK